jgi:hypothetical protein
MEHHFQSLVRLGDSPQSLARLFLSTLIMDAYDRLFTISCGECRTTSPMDEWTTTKTGGQLPPGEFQCPVCMTAWRREPNPKAKNYWDKFILITPILSRL